MEVLRHRQPNRIRCICTAVGKKQFELIWGSGSSVYIYETDDNRDFFVLKNSAVDASTSISKEMLIKSAFP